MQSYINWKYLILQKKSVLCHKQRLFWFKIFFTGIMLLEHNKNYSGALGDKENTKKINKEIDFL